MSPMFDPDGKLRIPIDGRMVLPKGKVDKDHDKLVVMEAYCQNGHDLMSDIEINGHNGLHFIYTDQKGDKETSIVVTAVVGECEKKILEGEPFEDGDIVKMLCPSCRAELPILLNCGCGSSIYLFYIDKQLHHHYGQSVCSRIGCIEASRLRCSKEVLGEFIADNCF